VPEKQEELNFENLDYLSQEAIIDLLVSILRNNKKSKPEE